MCNSDKGLAKRHRQTLTCTNFEGEAGETVKESVMQLIRYGRKWTFLLLVLVDKYLFNNY
jgi:hypothetical protein